MKHIALITGGTGGIGFACAELLAENGFDLMIVHRDRRSKMVEVNEKFEILRKKGANIKAFNINLVNEDSLDTVSEYLKNTPSASVKVFIHAVADANAGYLFGEGKILQSDDFEYTFKSMALSFVEWSQMLVNDKHMQQGGKIIGFTSMGSSRVLNEYVAIGMAKSALESACRYMAFELAPQNINVNLINSGIIDTNAIKIFDNKTGDLNRIGERNPSGRLTVPEDVAKTVMFLISDQSSRITGEIIRVDGGEQLI